MMIHKLITFMTFFAVILSGCSTPSPVTTPTLTTVEATPVVTSDTGAVKVTLISSYTQKPLAISQIACGEMIPLKGATVSAFIPKYNSSTAPSGTSDSSGTVVISGIKPGKYALIYLYPVANGMPALIKLPGSDNEISFDIVAGKVIDLGTLTVSIDPNQMH